MTLVIDPLSNTVGGKPSVDQLIDEWTNHLSCALQKKKKSAACARKESVVTQYYIKSNHDEKGRQEDSILILNLPAFNQISVFNNLF